MRPEVFPPGLNSTERYATFLAVLATTCSTGRLAVRAKSTYIWPTFEGVESLLGVTATGSPMPSKDFASASCSNVRVLNKRLFRYVRSVVRLRLARASRRLPHSCRKTGFPISALVTFGSQRTSGDALDSGPMASLLAGKALMGEK